MVVPVIVIAAIAGLVSITYGTFNRMSVAVGAAFFRPLAFGITGPLYSRNMPIHNGYQQQYDKYWRFISLGISVIMFGILFGLLTFGFNWEHMQSTVFAIVLSTFALWFSLD